MRRAKLIWIAVLIPVIATVLLIGYLEIALNKANHKDEIATAILFGQLESQDYQKNSHAIDNLNDSVLNAALSKRFQPGSNPRDAQLFFEKLGAKCEHQTNKAVFCKLHKTAGIACSSSLEISLEVGLEGSLKMIHAKEKTVCL